MGALEQKTGAVRVMSVLALMFLPLLQSCGSSPSSDVPSTDSDKSSTPVEVTWYLAGVPQKDQAVIEAAVNKMIEPAIGVKLKMVVFDYGVYDQKMTLKIASGEPFDLMFSSFSWINDYLPNVAKGAFLPLDDLLPKYAPRLYSQVIPRKYWDATRVSGKIYAVPNYQIMVSQKGFMVKKELADKYHFDYQSVKSIQQVEQFMEQIKLHEPGVTPLALSQSFNIGFLQNFGKAPSDYLDWTDGGVIRMGDPMHKLMTLQSDSIVKQSFTDFVNLMHRWYQKGYIRQDAAILADASPGIKAGKYALWPSSMKPGGAAQLTADYGFPVVQAPMTMPAATTQSALSSLTAISRMSQHPDKAMQLLEMVNTNKELYNLLVFGIEGKDYKKNPDGTIEKLPNAGYWSNIAWEFGDQFNAYYTKGQQPGTWEATMKLNEEAYPSPLLGFAPDISSFKAIVANMNAISQEFMPGLTTGTVDQEHYLPQYIEQLEQADPDHKLQSDMQRQLNDWLKTKK